MAHVGNTAICSCGHAIPQATLPARKCGCGARGGHYGHYESFSARVAERIRKPGTSHRAKEATGKRVSGAIEEVDRGYSAEDGRRRWSIVLKLPLVVVILPSLPTGTPWSRVAVDSDRGRCYQPNASWHWG